MCENPEKETKIWILGPENTFLLSIKLEKLANSVKMSIFARSAKKNWGFDKII